MIDKMNYKVDSTDAPVVEDKFANIPEDLKPKAITENIPSSLAKAAAAAVRSQEYAQIFKNPKQARSLWKNIGLAIAVRPAVKPIVEYDKDGQETFASQIQTYTYNKLMSDVDNLLFQDGPTEMEMIMGCQAVLARTNPSAFAAFVDRTGGKPVDESKIDAQVSNPYEELTDEELALIAELRAKKQKDA